MTLTNAIADTYQYHEAVESVSLTPQNPAAAAIAGVKALRRALSRREIAVAGAIIALEPDDVVFHLWNSTLSGVEPKGGDLITDGGGKKFFVQSLSLETFGTRWRAICRREKA